MAAGTPWGNVLPVVDGFRLLEASDSLPASGDMRVDASPLGDLVVRCGRKLPITDAHAGSVTAALESRALLSVDTPHGQRTGSCGVDGARGISCFSRREQRTSASVTHNASR